jgi:hypothetical protein
MKNPERKQAALEQKQDAGEQNRRVKWNERKGWKLDVLCFGA